MFLSNLMAARCQMGMSLAFHIIFSCVGIALPLMMVIAELMWLRTKDESYLILAKNWAKGSSILFAVGAVSGTILSFELGLLWPKFMEFSGSIIGLPFALEGFAFFGEAIFLGIYLYGWKRVPEWFHALCGVLVAFNGAASAVFVVCANAWMNTPVGFDSVAGVPTNVRPIEALMNPAAAYEVVHMLVAAYMATAILVAGIHAFCLLKTKNNQFHQRAFKVSILVAAVSSIMQVFIGDFAAQGVAHHQPLKLAAMEGQYKTEKGAPLRIGGIANSKERRTNFAIEIPYGLSILAFHDPESTIKGLETVSEEFWPPEPAVHLCFDTMVGCGSYLFLIGAWTMFLVWRRKKFEDQIWYLRAVILAAPTGYIAVEAGWMVTELGRQPWIIYQVMRTRDAVTAVPFIPVHLIVFFLLYLMLSAVVLVLMFRQIAQSPVPGEPSREKA